MPVIQFDESEKTFQGGKYPKLKLQQGERARINVVSQNLVTAYVHRLEHPEIVNGKPVMEMVKASRNSDEEVAKPKMVFVSNPGCFGNYTTLKEKGKDPENCIVCRAAQDNDGVDYPQRRFSVHIIKYAVREGGWDPQDPMSVTLLLWMLSSKRFDTLVDIQKEWGSLQKHDLKLGPCVNAGFQNYDIDVAKDAFWIASQERIDHVKQLIDNNKCEDIEAEIARKPKMSLLEEDIATVVAKTQQAASWLNAQAGVAPTAGAVAAGEPTIDIAEALAEQEAPVPPLPMGEGNGSSEPPPVEDFDDLLNSI